MPCRAAALPGRAGGARLWSGRPHGGVAAEIWAADRARAADGAVDGAPARRAGRYRRAPARSGAFAPLAALVARVQPGRVARPRTRAPDGCAARSSSADRNSVVYVKSESVRVALGGQRILKKNNKK